MLLLEPSRKKRPDHQGTAQPSTSYCLKTNDYIAKGQLVLIFRLVEQKYS